MGAEARLTRRKLVVGAGGLAATGLVSQGCLGALRSRAAARGKVVVVGAGLAGLTASYELRRAGFDVVVLEARPRVGGRVHTIRGPFSAGQHAEAGGEFVDLVHTRVRRYCRRFGLALEPTSGGFDELDDFVYRDGRVQRLDDFTTRAAERDVDRFYALAYRLGRDLDVRDPVASGSDLDRRSVGDLIDEVDPSPEGRFILERYVRDDYAAEPSELSLLLLLHAEKVYEEVSERAVEAFRVKGGNDRLARAFADRLGRSLRTSSPVSAISQSAAGVEVEAASGTFAASHCVVAAPLPALSGIDLSRAGLSADLTAAIGGLAYGRVTKTITQYRRRLWRRQGGSGEIYSDLPLGATYEVTGRQTGRPGILLAYGAGQSSDHLEGLAATQRVEETTASIDEVFPGSAQGVIGSASVAWKTEPYTGGSWIAPRPGQMAAHWDAIRRPAGRIVLAGEHTDTLFPGYMEGAIRSGRRAAEQIAAA